MEYVDIVDENDEVVGKASKQEAHQKGLLHRTVIAELIRSSGQWILVRQSADRQDAGQLVSPVGGHVRSSESEKEALKREAKEELGLIKAFKFRLIGKKIFNREVLGRKENHLFILYEIYSDDRVVLNAESVGYESFSMDQLRTELKDNPLKFGDAFHFVIRSFYPELI